MGVLKKITDEYFEKGLRNEDGKFLDIGGCRVVVPNEYTEEKFLRKANEVLKAMFVYFKKKENVNDEDVRECERVEMKNGYVMLFDSYDFFVKHTSEIKDFDEGMYKSIKKFLTYFMGDVSFSETIGQTDGIELVEKEDMDKMVSFFKREGLEKEINTFTMMKTHDFLRNFKEKMDLERIDIDFFKHGYSKNIVLHLRDIVQNPSIYRIRYAKEAVEWWKKEVVDADIETIRKKLSKYMDV